MLKVPKCLIFSRTMTPGKSSQKHTQITFYPIWGPGNPEIWGPKSPKNKILKIQIHSAQDVGKVWISRKQILPAPFHAILNGPEIQILMKGCRFPSVDGLETRG